MTKSPERRSRDANDRIQGVRVTEERTSLVLDLWRGDVPLVKTCWLFGVVVGICFAIAFAFIEYQSEGLSEGFGPLFIIGLIVLCFVYVAFINVAIWRSSNKYKGPKRWAILAKVAVIVSWSVFIREAWEIYGVVPT